MSKKQPAVTPWFPPDVKPVRIGPYEFRRWPNIGSGYSRAFWDGEHWRFDEFGMRADMFNEGWRGLSKQPK